MKSNSVSQASWLTEIPSERSIADITFPGTHDSLTYSFTLITGIAAKYAQTQDLNLSEQLECGVRYLDMRVDEKFRGRHSFAVCKDTLYDAFETIDSFLKENPSEVIIMRLKNEVDIDDWAAFDAKISELFEKYSSILYTGDGITIPTLGEVRGKIIILDNVDDHYITNTLSIGFKYSDDILDIQDDYSAPDFDVKYDEIVTETEKEIDTEYYIKLNHVSATGLTDFNILTSPTPRDYAEYLNPKVVSYLAEKDSPCCAGMLAYDFIDSDTALKTIMSNPEYSE